MTAKQMVINYAPGQECRVAVIDKGRLEEYHTQRMDQADHVGSIYVGKVTNVEAGIQAAFVDFGLEQNGFLHVSDLHPRYFPGADDDQTESVGKKTPRRDRPTIQDALKRGQEVVVQVLKEGVGTKGPTLTSYLSIPGRFLVMMPDMERVGVSRKVEDDDTRRKMREVLDALDLPDGFGFICRTAGLGRTKTELKRDLAYLQRLWKDMEKRRKKGSRPRLLYSESDLLVRALRDLVTADIERIVVDHPSALRRAGRFLKIVAPRSAANLVRYTGEAPVFHAMGIEAQRRVIHAREAPLPGGGRLVIDETEALVAIDVNSGKMRTQDAETTAFRTNMEAAEEICRQLKLRDLGGLIVNDLIDMRSAKHRREVENKFKELLKDDRARTTTLPISGFGILEMTRQRMRGSQESQHFIECPMCRGRGLIRRSDSAAGDALRDLASLLAHDRVAKVEMVVSPQLAGRLLSSERRRLTTMEHRSMKRVEVRVSEAIGVDRVTLYAYDERGADIDIEKLGKPKLTDKEFTSWTDTDDAEGWAADPAEEAAAEREALHDALEEVEQRDEEDPLEQAELSEDDDDEAPSGRKRRRRRRRRRGKRDEDAAAQEEGATAKTESTDEDDDEKASEASDEDSDDAAEDDEGGEKKRKRRRRGRRGGKGRKRATDATAEQESSEEGEAPEAAAETPADEPEAGDDTEPESKPATKKTKTRRSRKKTTTKSVDESETPAEESDADEPKTASKKTKKKTTRKKRSSKGADDADAEAPPAASANGAAKQVRTRRGTKKRSADADTKSDAPAAEAKPAPKPRTLYASRRKLSASERARIKPE